jgi:hypothetical protein
VVESAPTEGTTVAARVPRAAATPPVAPEDPT